MNLKILSADQHLIETKNTVSEERQITAKLIDYLSEINRRLLFLKLGYSSLFEFVTKELGLSEGAAQRRIQAMRLMHDVPETRKSYETGALSLSNAAKLQSYFQANKKSGKPKSITEKQFILKKAENQSQSKCEQMLMELSPELPSPERTRVLSPQLRELKFTISEELFAKIERLKTFLSHSHPNATLAELLEVLVTQSLAKFDKSKGLIQGNSAKNNTEKPDQTISVHTAAKVLPAGIRVALPVQLKRHVWQRAGGRCEFRSGDRRCNSHYRLEIDHIKPLALGGSNELSNFRLLCRSHNGLAAILALGTEKMVNKNRFGSNSKFG
jgi:5-methylcytosine-specific restriction endonuclease McrA